MKKFLSILLLVSMSLLACQKDMKTETKLKVTMTYELDVVEQDNISHYVIQVSTNNSATWEDAGMILAEENTTGMDHKYAISIDISKWYVKNKTFYQRTLSFDKGSTNGKASWITSQVFE